MVPGGTLELANPRKFPGVRARSLVWVTPPPPHSGHTFGGGHGPPLLSVAPLSWSLRCPHWSLLLHLEGSPKPAWGGGGAAPSRCGTPTCPCRSCTPLKCAGTRSSERRCPARGLWTRGAWILRGDINTRGFWFRLVPLCLDATSVPAPSLPCTPSSCFSFRSELSSPSQALPQGATRAWHAVPQFRHQTRQWLGPLLVALLPDVVTASINPVVVAGTCGSLCWLVL